MTMVDTKLSLHSSKANLMTMNPLEPMFTMLIMTLACIEWFRFSNHLLSILGHKTIADSSFFLADLVIRNNTCFSEPDNIKMSFVFLDHHEETRFKRDYLPKAQFNYLSNKYAQSYSSTCLITLFRQSFPIYSHAFLIPEIIFRWYTRWFYSVSHWAHFFENKIQK